MPVPEMPEIKYVEMPLSYSFWDRKAYLRQYTFDMGTGERTVDEKSKIGQPIQRGESIRIIYPLAESSDGEWVQAMGKDGTCGYIRKSRVDIEQLNAKAAVDAKPLPLYRLKLTSYFTGAADTEDERKKKIEALINYIEKIKDFDETTSLSDDHEIIETSINKMEAEKHGFHLYKMAEEPEIKTFMGALEEVFDQDEATYGIRFCAEERCRQRMLFKETAMAEMEWDVGQINQKDTTRNDAMIIVGEENHRFSDTRNWMKKELEKGKEGALHDVGRIYMEDFMIGRDQKVLDRYLIEGKDEQLPHALERYCEVNSGFKDFLEAVRNHNLANEKDTIRIIAIGTEVAQTDTKKGFQYQVERVAKFNLAAREIINENPCPKGKRGLIYTGAAHAFAHPSLDNGKVIAGFAQLYNQDVMIIEKGQSTLHSKDSIKDRTQNNSVISITQAQLADSLTAKASESRKFSQNEAPKSQFKDKEQKKESTPLQREKKTRGGLC